MVYVLLRVSKEATMKKYDSLPDFEFVSMWESAIVAIRWELCEKINVNDQTPDLKLNSEKLANNLFFCAYKRV